jgi:ClpP class serine protease
MYDELWACEESHLKTYLETLYNAHVDEKAISAFALLAPDKSVLTVNGDTARIAITGILKRGGATPLEKFFGIDITSYNDIQEAIQKVERSKTIKTVIFDFNTPGGQVDGADETAQMIGALCSRKNAMAINHGLTASAGIWLASQVPKIEAVAPTAMTGSIGIVITAVDRDPKAENRYGIVRVKVVSKNAPKKAPDLTTKAGIAVLEERADALERIFITRVAAGRGVTEKKVISSFGEGDLLIAQDPGAGKSDAISVGLIDGLVEGAQAAVIGDEPDVKAESEEKPMEDAEEHQIEIKQQGDSAKRKEAKMSLRDRILALDSSLGEAFDKEISDAREDGKAEVEARVQAVIPVLESADSKKSMVAMAIEVLKGEETAATLKASRAAYAALKEEQVEAEAKKETEKQGETKAEANDEKPLLNEDGSVADEAAMKSLTLKTLGRESEVN